MTAGDRSVWSTLGQVLDLCDALVEEQTLAVRCAHVELRIQPVELGNVSFRQLRSAATIMVKSLQGVAGLTAEGGGRVALGLSRPCPAL